jgi:hypothetical protein
VQRPRLDIAWAAHGKHTVAESLRFRCRSASRARGRTSSRFREQVVRHPSMLVVGLHAPYARGIGIPEEKLARVFG